MSNRHDPTSPIPSYNDKQGSMRPMASAKHTELFEITSNSMGYGLQASRVLRKLRSNQYRAGK